jgi:mono/diheme cytochrome c family protein
MNMRLVLCSVPILLLVAGVLWWRPAQGAPSTVERGRYLVTGFGCGDCHTPLKMGPNGPEPDTSRLLSGHPESLVMPPPPKLPEGPWLVTSSATNTAWAGPWGVSFTANLTPDPETGLGTWTEETFVAAIRSGRHLGRGRPILPPMPWPATRTLTDEDLSAMFAYLQSLAPIRNRVPDPIPPADGQ